MKEISIFSRFLLFSVDISLRLFDVFYVCMSCLIFLFHLLSGFSRLLFKMLILGDANDGSIGLKPTVRYADWIPQMLHT